MTTLKWVSSLLAVLALTAGCQPSATSQLSADSSSQNRASSAKASLSDAPVITGPQVAQLGQSVSLSLSLPDSLSNASIAWDFADGSAVASGGATVIHPYNRIGSFQTVAILTDANQNQIRVLHVVNVLDQYDGFECSVDTALSGGYDAISGLPVSYSVVIPSCLTNAVQSVQWVLGDNTPNSSGLAVQHIYSAPGDYALSAVVNVVLYGNAVAITLNRNVHVAAPAATPGPTATPNPLACPTADALRESLGSSHDSQVACGIDGHKTMTYKTKTVEKCEARDGTLLWTVISNDEVLQSEGACQGQSCTLADGSKILDQGSKTFYSSAAPTGACSDAAVSRTCSNGVLGGSSLATSLVCKSGCGAFGIDGTVKTGVTVGQTTVPVTCQFGETGVNSVYNQLADQACHDGQVTTSNTRQGAIKSAGICPTYTWASTDNFGACSADCGGSQSRVFVCMNNAGQVSSNDRCASMRQPVEQRVCDGNPDAVRRTDKQVTQDSSGSTQTCPKNQIGVSVSERDVTVTSNYACIDHAVKVASQTTTYGAWVTASYCRDYVAYRCSQDSLDNTHAQGRYDWMKKCQDQVPVIKEFLTNFEDVKVSGFTIDDSARKLYPTFMNHATNPEKPWIAPTSATSSCSVPKAAYVAAVCVSSCATPDQEIMAQAEEKLKLRYVPFIDALTQNYHAVATLSSDASLSSRNVKMTEVDQWVTELLDTDHEILNFRMKSGRKLRLTPNHTIVTAQGSMKLAQEFQVGESLVELGGHLDPIVSIEKTTFTGKVYNLFVKSSEPAKNIVVTNGYLNGTAFFQNEGAVNMNQVILKNQLLNGVFKK